MRKKIIGTLVMTLLIANVLPALGVSNNLDVEFNSASMADTVVDQSQEGNTNSYHLSVGVEVCVEWHSRNLYQQCINLKLLR